MILLKVEPKNLEEIVKIAAQIIKQGKVIIFPTDTVYGLVCDATNKKAVEKIFRIKERPKKKPLPVFVKDMEIAKELAVIDKNQERFLRKVWPGDVTAVLLRKQKTEKLYGVDEETIALRIPDYPLLNDLMDKLNIPLAETSVNISGKPEMTGIAEIIDYFKSRKLQPDLIVDAGDLGSSKPSTVIDLTGKKPKILRK